MNGSYYKPKKDSTVLREAYYLDFTEQVRALVKVPLMVTGGFRTVEGMNAALSTGALDLVGLSRLMAIDPDAPIGLLQGRDSPHTVKPIKTGIKPVDNMGVMEVLWYTAQLARIAKGGNPKPNESGLVSFLKSLVGSIWGTHRTKRLRA